MSGKVKSPELNGREFTAHVRLTNREGHVLARVGNTCEHVDISSLPWLEEQGYITRKSSNKSQPGVVDNDTSKTSKASNPKAEGKE